MCTDSFLLQFILIGFCHSLTVSHSHATFTFNSCFPLHFAVFYFYSTLVITLHLHVFVIVVYLFHTSQRLFCSVFKCPLDVTKTPRIWNMK